MTQTIDIKAIRKLSVKKRLELIKKIWETIDNDEPALVKRVAGMKRRLLKAARSGMMKLLRSKR
ncbi:hypothetical protein GPROT1_03786 [Gammaproteobacteria bacterium]|nr:hypothetical protein GPROT1_03786 [Gammaproteobacteria bacterium]